MSIRIAASIAAAMVFCACSAPKGATSGAAVSAPPKPAVMNASVSRAGQPDAIRLDPAQRAEVDATVAKAPAAQRPRLRYALATGDDGKVHLVVYDGEGLGAAGRHPGRKHEYIVFKVLNATTPVHYDPQQNSLVSPIPPPPQRETSVTK
ncbi:MAG: hypothetical protein QOJ39_1207 [Candidatus Eremiobacteraeota bacterium]|nr:hypothetical protein [Candidatus Eremiobacteraeota bacterium]